MNEQYKETKEYTPNQSIWIAAALLSYEVYERNPEAPLSEYYFKQSVMIQRAQLQTKNAVNGAQASSWCCAGKEANTNNYLSGDHPQDTTLRRLTGFYEYPEKTHPEDLNMEDVLTANGHEIFMEDLFDFVRNQYPGTVQNRSSIDYIGVLKYLEQNREVPYSIPETTTDPAEKARVLEITQKGQNAVNELCKLSELFQQKYGIEKYLSIPWLDGSNTKTKKYLWLQLKYPDRMDDPTSISVFVEMRNAKESTFRVSLEIMNDGATKETMQRYHTHLDLPLENGLVYCSGSNEWGRPEPLQETQDVIRENVRSGKYRKVQICAYINQISGQTNEYFENAILEAVGQLLPYYNHVVNKEVSQHEEDKREKEKETMNSFDKNMILYGPPGTGKTYSTAIYTVAICDDLPIEQVRETDYSKIMDRYHELQSEGRVAFTTFHQSYGYEEFIEGIKPVIAKDDENEAGADIEYDIVDGVFKSFCRKAGAANAKDSYVFIIDEINRGNISKIFGELITLIEDTKREGLPESIPAVLPYSNEEFVVPQNVYIVGTMNTADRSIALMDTALRRRFRFVEMMPDADVLRAIGANLVQDLDVALMLEKINERITFLYDREHTIGHAFFTKLKDSPTIETLAAIFQKSIIPLLQEYFYEDYQKIQLVLGDNGKSDPTHKFILDEAVKVKSIFKGNPDDVVDLPEKKYTINQRAFTNIESYKEII